MPHKILLVEDEENLAKAILLNLDLEGYNSTWIKNGNTANSNLLSKPNFYDLIILDVMLPEKDGLDICKNVRNAHINTPILFLSAKNSSQDKVQGLKAGADDYLGKPFNLEEFLLRVSILLARNSSPKAINSHSPYSFGKNEVNFESLQVRTYTNESINLSLLEGNVLQYLIVNEGKVVSRDEIIQEVWNDHAIKGRSIDNMISRFRKWFEQDHKSPQHFISIRGIGYKFVN